MTTKAAFTPEEWTAITQAPLATSLYITMAAPSLFGSMGEVFGTTRRLVEGAQQATGNELLDSILAEFKQLDTARAAQPQLQSHDMAAVKSELTALIGAAVAALNAKATPAEASGAKQWLYDIAVAAANASKEGGFMGIGGTRVSDEETAALKELAGQLGVTPAAPTATA